MVEPRTDGPSERQSGVGLARLDRAAVTNQLLNEKRISQRFLHDRISRRRPGSSGRQLGGEFANQFERLWPVERTNRELDDGNPGCACLRKGPKAGIGRALL